MDGVSYSLEQGNLVLSHSGRHIEKGKVKASATVESYYNEITPHKYYERTVDEYYERSVDEYYERGVTNYFVRPVQEFYNRYSQKYLVPVFTKKVNTEIGTLVTRLTYSDNTKKAKPVDGNAFKNGHTYVAIDVEKASQDGGIWYTIADSSKNNGKKTPSEYNRPIDYKYNVSIKDGKLTVSFDDQLVSASVGAYVVANPSNFPGNAPKHYSNSVTVNLPKNNGTVYIYTHISSVSWYAGENEYEFLEWRYDDSRTEYDENYTLVDTKYGDYELEDTKYETKKIDVPYNNDNLTLTVNGEEKALNEELVLEPGKYTFTVSSATTEFEPVSKVVTILPGQNNPIDFDILYVLDDVTLDSVIHQKDKDATIHQKDLDATIHQKDLDTTIHQKDKDATIHQKDLEAIDIYSDEVKAPIYNEEYLFRDDIKLGNSFDPFGEYAVRIN